MCDKYESGARIQGMFVLFQRFCIVVDDVVYSFNLAKEGQESATLIDNENLVETKTELKDFPFGEVNGSDIHFKLEYVTLMDGDFFLFTDSSYHVHYYLPTKMYEIVPKHRTLLVMVGQVPFIVAIVGGKAKFYSKTLIQEDARGGFDDHDYFESQQYGNDYSGGYEYGDARKSGKSGKNEKGKKSGKGGKSAMGRTGQEGQPDMNGKFDKQIVLNIKLIIVLHQRD